MGIISDKWDKKNLIIAGFVLRFCSSAIYGLAQIPFQLLLAILLQSIGMSLIGLNLQLYLADYIESSYLGRAISFFSTAMGVGVTLGPLVGGIASGQWGYQQSYFIASSIALIGILIALLGLKSVKSSSPSTSTHRSLPQVSRLFSILRNPRILSLSILSIVSMTMMGLIMTYFPVLAQGLGFNPEVIGFIFFVRGLATTVIRIPTGLAIRKLGEPFLFFSALALGVIGIVALPLTSNYVTIILLMIMQGVSFGSYLVSSRTYLLKISSPTERGTTLGLARIFQGTINTLSSYLIGLSAESFGLKTTYLTIGFLLGVMLSIMIILGYLKQIFKNNLHTV
jgi:MFS family permease